MIEDLRGRLADRELKLEVSDEAKAFIAENGYSPTLGARPLRRFIQSQVETALAREIIRSDPQPGTTLLVDVQNGEITVGIK
jgi:ATP-dependent Clp protease ATP-binding subunit ClpB